MQPYAPSTLAEQLSRTSTPYRDPVAKIRWEQLSTEQFWLPPEAVSLDTVPAFMALPIESRRRLSQYEFLNFIEAGLWLEGIFMERITRSMRSHRGSRTVLKYRLHELREEAGHSLMFLELMERSGLSIPYNHRPRFHLADIFGRRAPMESLGFWMAILIGEEVPDRLNRYLRSHASDVCPTILEMSTSHVIDEARHIAYARETVEERMAQLHPLSRLFLKPLLRKLVRQFVDVFYYPNPALYELAGLAPGADWARAARANPARAAFVDLCLNPTLQLLRNRGFEIGWPKPKT